VTVLKKTEHRVGLRSTFITYVHRTSHAV